LLLAEQAIRVPINKLALFLWLGYGSKLSLASCDFARSASDDANFLFAFYATSPFFANTLERFESWLVFLAALLWFFVILHMFQLMPISHPLLVSQPWSPQPCHQICGMPHPTVPSSLEPPATSSSNLFLIDLVGHLELREEELPSNFGKNNTFEQTSRTEKIESYCIIIAKQMREFTLVNTISSADNREQPRLLLSILWRKIARMTCDKMQLWLLQTIRFA
jgi:hypothetical protein